MMSSIAILRILLISLVIGMLVNVSHIPMVIASGGAETTATKDKAAPEKGDSKKKPDESDDLGSIIGGKIDGDPLYVGMKPLLLPMITDRGAQQLVILKISLQVKGVSAAVEVQKVMPRIRSAILEEIYGGLGDGSLRRGNTLDIVAIKKRIGHTLKKMPQSENIVDILIQDLSQRVL